MKSYFIASILSLSIATTSVQATNQELINGAVQVAKNVTQGLISSLKGAGKQTVDPRLYFLYGTGFLMSYYGLSLINHGIKKAFNNNDNFWDKLPATQEKTDFLKKTSHTAASLGLKAGAFIASGALVATGLGITICSKHSLTVLDELGKRFINEHKEKFLNNALNCLREVFPLQ